MIPNLSYKDGFQDRPTPRPNVDVVREMRHSPRTREEVSLALSAIWELYHFIDGVGSKKECLEKNLDFMHILYERYLEESISDRAFPSSPTPGLGVLRAPAHGRL